MGGGETMTAGILRGIEDGWFMAEIADSAFTYQQALEKGTKKIVGVNAHTSTTAKELEILRVSHEVEVEQKALLGRRKGERDQDRVTKALADMVAVARTDANMIPAMPWRRPGPRPRWARSATRCGPSGARTASPPASDPGPRANTQELSIWGVPAALNTPGTQYLGWPGRGETFSGGRGSDPKTGRTGLDEGVARRLVSGGSSE
jgi:hypothetical protein